MGYVKLFSFLLLHWQTISQFVSQIAPYFANTQGASDAEGGGRTAPFSIGNAIGALLAGQIIKRQASFLIPLRSTQWLIPAIRFGTYKKLSLISLFFCIASSVAILLRWPHTIGMSKCKLDITYAHSFLHRNKDFTLKETWMEANVCMKLIGVWEEILTTFPFGLFGGIALSAQFIGLYQCSSKQYMATAISMYYMSQQIGVALGISISSGLLKHQFHATLQRIMTEVPGYTKVGPMPHPFYKGRRLTCIRIKLLEESWMIPLSWHYFPKKSSHSYARVILPVSGSYQVCNSISRLISATLDDWYFYSVCCVNTSTYYSANDFYDGEVFILTVRLWQWALHICMLEKLFEDVTSTASTMYVRILGDNVYGWK